MPSRMPRSATPSRSAGQRSRIVSRIAQPATTRSARSLPMHGTLARSARSMPGEPLADLAHRRGRHDQPVDRRRSYAAARDARWRASSPCRWCRAAAACPPGGSQPRGERREASRHARRASGIGGGAARRAASPCPTALGQRHDAPRHAVPVEDARAPARRDIDQHQFGRSAADVEDQRRAVARLEQRMAAEHRQPRFLLGGDDVERDAGLAIARAR